MPVDPYDLAADILDEIEGATGNAPIPAAETIWLALATAMAPYFGEGGGAVSSVSAGSSMVDVSPTTGDVVVDVVPANFTGIPQSAVTNLTTDLAGKAAASRTISATAPVRIDGGGSADLSADRTLSISVYAGGAPGVVPTGAGSASKFLREDGSWAETGGGAYAYTTKTTDSFNRTNSASSLGNTDGSSPLDPLTWVQNRGTWGINGNAAYCSATGAGTQVNAASVNLGVTQQFVQATITTLPTQNSTGIGIILGLVDLNGFYYLQCNRSSGGAFSYVMGKAISNAPSTLLSIAGITPSANDVIRLERVQYGIISTFINGVHVGSIFDGSIPTGTRAGLLEITSGGAVSGGRLDVFSAGAIA